MTRHLVLVGLPGSGKTTVGRRVAVLLGAAFTDIDDMVAGAAGRPVSDIFSQFGEAAFRRLERAAMEEALAAPPHVVAPGAGWAAEPGNLETAGGAHLVHLRVSPETAARRLLGDATRPLLAGGDPVERLTALLAARDSWYSRAHSVVNGSGPLEEVADLVAAIARAEAGYS